MALRWRGAVVVIDTAAAVAGLGGLPGPEVDQIDVVGVVLALVVFVIVWACNCRLRFLVKSLKIVSITDLSFTSPVG